MKSSNLDLYTNTIGDFHRNLMDYYHLAGERHSQHSGEYVKYVGNFPVPKFAISALNLKDRTILRDRDWGSKEEWRDYMMAKGYNKSNTKLDMVESEDLPSDMHLVLKQFKIKLPNFTMNVQPPGSVVPAHEDTWYKWCDRYPNDMEKYTFEDTKFYIWFLTDKEVGHSFQAGSTDIDWKKGDLVEMPYYCKHATANAGFNDKMLIQCLGIKI